MAYTQQQYDKLKAAIATGATSVYYGDKRVDYRNLNEMKQILSDMEIELGIKKQSSRIIKTSFVRGTS